jgi:hypothetical protein
MAKLTRYLQKIFGDIAGSNQIAEFGSAAASGFSGGNTYNGTTIDPDIVQTLSNYDEGWFAAVDGEYNPAIEDTNAVDWLWSRQLKYLTQQGIAEWIATETYYIGNFVAADIYTFTVTAAAATIGAKYTNNSQTFTVLGTIAAGTTLVCSATGTPAASGTLTKSSGTGDATITFASKVFTGAYIFSSLTDSNTGNTVLSTTNWKKVIGPNTVVTSAADYTVLAGDRLVRVSGAHTWTLPDATLNTGNIYTLKKTDSGTTSSIAFTGGQSADGQTSLTLTEQYSFYQFQSNGTTYDIVAWG